MYLVVIAWLYVALMMALAEATADNGSLLGAIVTFFLYGFVPLSLVVYLMLGSKRCQRIRAREAAEAAETAETSVSPDAGGHAPGAAQAGGVAPMGKEP